MKDIVYKDAVSEVVDLMTYDPCMNHNLHPVDMITALCRVADKYKMDTEQCCILESATLLRLSQQ
jgi:hypothetical protein